MIHVKLSLRTLWKNCAILSKMVALGSWQETWKMYVFVRLGTKSCLDFDKGTSDRLPPPYRKILDPCIAGFHCNKLRRNQRDFAIDCLRCRQLPSFSNGKSFSSWERQLFLPSVSMWRNNHSHCGRIGAEEGKDWSSCQGGVHHAPWHWSGVSLTIPSCKMKEGRYEKSTRVVG